MESISVAEFVTTRAMRKKLAKECLAYPAAELQLLPIKRFNTLSEGDALRAWRSRYFLVQEFCAPAPAVIRLSVNRTERMDTPQGERWKDGITWDDLQWIKGQCGYADLDAVEVYPASKDVVNAANLRHIWIMREPVAFAWRS